VTSNGSRKEILGTTQSREIVLTIPPSKINLGVEEPQMRQKWRKILQQARVVMAEINSSAKNSKEIVEFE